MAEKQKLSSSDRAFIQRIAGMQTDRREFLLALRQVKNPHQLAAILGIQHWDYLIVGDGSGTSWQNACGFSSVVFSRTSGSVRHFSGGMSAGTNIFAEIAAYITPLLALAKSPGLTGRDVHIVTDCQYLVEASDPVVPRRSYTELWAFFDAFVRQGVRISWHWVPRNVLAANRFAHDAANDYRKAAANTYGLLRPKLDRLDYSKELVDDSVDRSTGQD